ncbi:RNA polymerase subunit sigma-70 [Ruania zhangjianzhongii]|uniref:RNA polymerase subunit sigma-70 n=1 Tax=Ruania zhangjianzhongii TaxID=2603206 RepID=UPI001AF01264|nr:RNA polymerase subunit sigma-70 [Ruania zhangjianzhongii]
MDSDILALARAGDERAFRELTEPHLRELHVHCYRMLGSVTDADDQVQETLLAAWQHLAGFEQRASVRTWLYRIATRRCLNALRDRARRIPMAPVAPFTTPAPSQLSEVTWLQPYPDVLLTEIPDAAPGPAAQQASSEAIELAFITALQQLPPQQVAVLLLRDVLGFSTADAADVLDTSATAVKAALQRARAGLRDHNRPRVRSDPAEEQTIAAEFARAYVAGDIEMLLELLSDQAWLTMPPAPHRYDGRDAIGGFWRSGLAWRGERRLHLLPAGRANTDPAFGSYLAEPGSRLARLTGMHVVTIAGDRIGAVTSFHTPELADHFGLPRSVELEPGRDRG